MEKIDMNRNKRVVIGLFCVLAASLHSSDFEGNPLLHEQTPVPAHRDSYGENQIGKRRIEDRNFQSREPYV